MVIWSFVIIVVLGTIVIVWDRKRLKDKNKKELEESNKLTPFQMDCMLNFEEIDDTEKYIHDDREVEFNPHNRK